MSFRFLLGERARALSAAFACFGLATMAPQGLTGVGPFLRSPPGLGVLSVALIVTGVSVEETGTIRRIRLGIWLRLAAGVILAAAALWAALLGAPGPSLAELGWILFAAGAAGVIVATRYDLAVLADPRHGQAVRLESITLDALHLSVNGAPVTIPTDIVIGAVLAESGAGRGVLITVKDRGKISGHAGALPWVAATRVGDTLVLTEHQAALDAEVLAKRVLEATSPGRGSGYR